LAKNAHLSPGLRFYIITLTVALVCGGFGTAVTYIWTGINIKRHSRKATVAALTAGWINVIFIVVLLSIAMTLAIHNSERNTVAMIVSTLFYLFIAALNGVVVWLTRRVLQEPLAPGAA
jgi:hypothetical protein